VGVPQAGRFFRFGPFRLDLGQENCVARELRFGFLINPFRY
jgi:hypothetical protein